MPIPKPDPRLFYDFVAATKVNKEQLLDFVCNEFIQLEPFQKAAKLKPSDVRYLYDWVVQRALHYPYSLVVIEKATGRWVGVRLLSIEERNKDLLWQPFEFDVWKLPLKVLEFCDDLEKAEELFWETRQDVDKILKRELSFVLPEHQRRGIARCMISYGLDYDELRNMGVQAIVSDAASVANQTLLASEGYVHIASPKKKPKKPLHDGSEGLKIMLKDLRI